MKMKILEIVPSLHCGGAERFVVDFTNGIVQTRKHEAILLSVARILSGDFLAHQLDPSVKRINLGLPETRVGAIAAMPMVWNIIRKECPDVVHAHLGGIQLAALAELFHRPRAEYFYTVHSDAFFDAGNRLWMTKMLFGAGVQPIAISPEAERSFLSAYGFHAPIIENGCSAKMPSELDLSNAAKKMRAWKSSSNSCLLINIARFCPQKNQIATARAAASLVLEGADLDLVFMGDEKNETIRSEILSLGCPRIHIAGIQSNPLAYLAQVDFLVLFSAVEGLPITLLEAFALGVPACVTPVGGMKDLVRDNFNGLIAQDCTEKSIRKTMERALMMSKAERIRFKEGAQETFAPYSMKRCVERYLNLMEQRIRKKK